MAEDVKLGPFTAGLNNKDKAEGGPADALLEAVNVDLDAQGWPQLRRGYTVHVAGTAHSLFNLNGMLAGYVDGALKVYRLTADGLQLEATLLTGLADRFITTTSDDFDTWYSNGVIHGRIAEDLSLHPFWPGTPNPVTLTASASGALAAGQYEVSVTVLDLDGRESAASPPVCITLTAGQGIAVTLPAAPEGAVSWKVYVSPPNGDVLYRCALLPANATSYAIGAHQAGEPLETQWMSVMPPATTLRIGHNRMLTLQGNVLRYSPPYRFGLVEDTANIILGHEARMAEPVGEGSESAGWWVSDHRRTYFMGGADPATWRQTVRYQHPAVPGTSCVVDGFAYAPEMTEPVAYWMAANGTPCFGLPGGQLAPQREATLALPTDAERGTSALMLFDGIRQILTMTLGGATNRAAVSDSADATIRRRTA